MSAGHPRQRTPRARGAPHAPDQILTDHRFMRLALALGRRGHGRVWPNPSVGCVLVKDGSVVGRGWTQAGGRPHAETEALQRAGSRAQGATCYVTLEPCANWGHTAPCAKALVERGVARVVIGCIDPDPRVNGKGIAWLQEAGLDVTVGCLEAEARAAHLGLYRRIMDRRPMVTLKLAQSLDGKIAALTGRSQWLTGALARAAGHALRAEHDAVLVGVGTALLDDPALDCRLPGLTAASPVRVVADRRLRLPLSSRLARSAGRQPLWVVTRSDAPVEARQGLAAAGAVLLDLPEDPGGAPDSPAPLLAVLAARGITRLLVEGGMGIASTLLAADLVDRLYLFTAPLVLGDDAHGWAGRLGLESPVGARRWRAQDERWFDEDRLIVLTPDGAS